MTNEHQKSGPDDHETPDLKTEVRMILSAVARMEGEWGADKIAAVLCGAESQWIADQGLDDLSVYGLLSHHSKLTVIAMLGALVDQQLVSRGPSKTLELTVEGTAVMKDESDLGAETRKLLKKARGAQGLDISG